jgi:hypothetical protein
VAGVQSTDFCRSLRDKPLSKCLAAGVIQAESAATQCKLVDDREEVCRT